MDSCPNAHPKVFVLCFDGTGNKFSGLDTDSNILKIYRMLDRTEGSQFHYYQPGIGTYVTTTSLDHTSPFTRFRSWYDKAKDSAVGTSFANHVMGGYRFLMRYYTPGDDIYFFGFSRGAYTARFLAEMLDHVGLLSAGNEELSRFAWKTFSKWQARRGGDSEKDKQKEADMYIFMKNFRETFSRPVRRIRFLGLFDTVNSVPRFESAFMQRSKFPYTARSSAKIVRHAVSINERRAKFRQDLLTGSQLDRQDRNMVEIHRYAADLPQLKTGIEHSDPDDIKGSTGLQTSPPTQGPARPAEGTNVPTRGISDMVAKPVMTTSTDELHQKFQDAPEHPQRQAEAHHESHTDVPNPPRSTVRRNSLTSPMVTRSVEDLLEPDAEKPAPDNPSQPQHPHSHPHHFPHPHHPLHHRQRSVYDRSYSQTGKSQDIEEVWFPGSHGDIGGGWPKAEHETYQLAHSPLVWMVQEAQLAGLKFDPRRLVELNCTPNAVDEYGKKDANQAKRFHEALNESQLRSVCHDPLDRHGGLNFQQWMAWWIMEYLPFRRMDLRPDGSWTAIRWPLPRGEVRDIPDDAKVHVSVVKRMEVDESFRPGNLIVGGGGRGVKVAPKHYGMGEWEVWRNEGDPVREIYIKKPKKNVMF